MSRDIDTLTLAGSSSGNEARGFLEVSEWLASIFFIPEKEITVNVKIEG